MTEILEVPSVPDIMLHGVGTYFGSMLPKEKLLVEMAFIDNDSDAALLVDRADEFARAIARGITDYEQE